jgi:hypothetical protein
LGVGSGGGGQRGREERGFWQGGSLGLLFSLKSNRYMTRRKFCQDLIGFREGETMQILPAPSWSVCFKREK